MYVTEVLIRSISNHEYLVTAEMLLQRMILLACSTLFSTCSYIEFAVTVHSAFSLVYLFSFELNLVVLTLVSGEIHQHAH